LTTEDMKVQGPHIEKIPISDTMQGPSFEP